MGLTLARIATALPLPTPSEAPLPFQIQKAWVRKNPASIYSELKFIGIKFKYLNSSIKTLEHWSILQHVRYDHKPIMHKQTSACPLNKKVIGLDSHSL